MNQGIIENKFQKLLIGICDFEKITTRRKELFWVEKLERNNAETGVWTCMVNTIL